MIIFSCYIHVRNDVEVAGLYFYVLLMVLNLENDDNPDLCDAHCSRKCQCLFLIKTGIFGLYGTKEEQPRRPKPRAHVLTASQRPSAAG